MSTASIFRIFEEGSCVGMFMKNIRWKLVLLWAILALIVLSVGSYCYDAYALRRPLEKKLELDPHVLKVHISNSRDKIVIALRLKYVDDLPATYSRLNEEVRATLVNRDYEIVIEDDSAEILEKAYASIHYYIEEARIRGNFGEMADKSQAVLNDAGLEDFGLTVDGENIFVQMRVGDNYLYRVKMLKGPLGGAGT